MTEGDNKDMYHTSSCLKVRRNGDGMTVGKEVHVVAGVSDVLLSVPAMTSNDKDRVRIVLVAVAP